MTSALFAAAIGIMLVLHLHRLVRNSRAAAAARLASDAQAVAAVIGEARVMPTDTAGVAAWAGRWRGQRVQVKTIVDTLAVRKLPSRWLSVTITEKVDIPAIFDLMMRPGSATTFSNFDHLPDTLPTPANFPEEAVIRSDRGSVRFPLDLIAGHLGIFADGRAKELLVTRNGVRIVWLLAEADRARYGVFRQAAFSDTALEPGRIEELLACASSLCTSLNATARRAAA